MRENLAFICHFKWIVSPEIIFKNTKKYIVEKLETEPHWLSLYDENHWDISQNISVCAPENKESHTGVNDTRASKWCQMISPMCNM